MSVPLGVQSASVPAESWDDDFDFLSQSGSPNRHKNTYDPSDTTRLSTATEDWDVDNATSSTSITNHDHPRPFSVPTDKSNAAPFNLADWAEDDPTTPQKPAFSAAVVPADNWDDDFLDKTHSARPSPRGKNDPSKQSVGGKLRAGVASQHRKPIRLDTEEEHESWDDEFDFRQSPAKRSRYSTPNKSQRTPVRRSERNLPQASLESRMNDLSDDEDDDDFGVASTEEDRTVTARSRRAPQQHTPPPPLPSIPFTLIPLSQQPSTSSNTHFSAPFPRSPTTSVFSVPTPSVADTNSLRSTAPLRPSISRSSANNALKHLPPSPPIHRERRRLRKKSRPQPQGMIELMDMAHVYPLSDTDADYRLEEIDERRTPSPPPVAPDPVSPNAPLVLPPAISTGGALLSRIGSVKRWTSRKKRGSTTPSEVAKEEKIKDITTSDGQPTPRARASLSSLLHTSQPAPPPPPSSSWFFRPSSPVYNRGRNSIGKNSNPRSSFTGSRSGSMTDLSMRGSIYASSSNCDEDDSFSPRTPNKLAKRKSLGFAQLNKGPEVGDKTSMSAESDKIRKRLSNRGLLDNQKPTGKRPVSMQGHRLPSTVRQAATHRHASYETPQPKELSASTNDLHETTRDRRRSTSRGMRSRSRGPPQEDPMHVNEGDREIEQKERDEKEQEKSRNNGEGSRGFMGSIRRLSMVGRHRRNKSGASLKNMEALAPVFSESSSTSATGATPASENPPSLPPIPSLSELRISRPHTPRTPKPTSTLLPPIELQPPSPPRDVPAEATRPFSQVLDTGIDATLSPHSSDSSFLPPSTISSTSATSSPLPLSPILKSPASRSPAAPKTPKSPSSPPQTASLGRSTISPKHTMMNMDLVQRRNSLNDLKNDLKIPARISQAQQGLKRDLIMVRDFALLIEQLKKQQELYNDLTSQIQQKLDAQTQLVQEPVPRAVSPSFFNLAKPKSRARSNTNPGNSSHAGGQDLAVAFQALDSKYRISWECAELLVDLADGTPTPASSHPNPLIPVGLNTGEKQGRERAITLAGDESKPAPPTHGMSKSVLVSPTPAQHPGPPPASPTTWRASTGRHDLNHRQLMLLREMLNNAGTVFPPEGHDFSLPVLEESVSSLPDSLRVNRDWRWDNPMNSTITLPPEEQAGELVSKRRKMSKLMGMTGLRDMLRALKRSYSENSTSRYQIPSPLPTEHHHATVSTTSLTTDTSYDRSSASHHLPQPATGSQQRRRAKTSAGPEMVAKHGRERGRDREPRELSQLPHAIQSLTKSSPRRPSLASIFRLGSKKNATSSASVTNLSTYGSDGTSRDASRPTRPEPNAHDNAELCLEEDWDRIDSASDPQASAKVLTARLESGADHRDGGSTVRVRKGKSPYLQYQAPSSSSQLHRPTTPRRSASGSQLSLWAESPSKSRVHANHQIATRAPRLSNVDEGIENTKQKEQSLGGRASSRVSSGKIQNSGSLRAVPPQTTFPESRLAMTPENIKPLLENAKEVYARLEDCIVEVQQLLNDKVGERSISGSSCASASGQSSTS